MSTELQKVLSPEQSAAWLQMATIKNDLVESLTKAELKAQSVLMPLSDVSDYKTIDEALVAYKKMYAEMSEMRIAFTSQIDNGLISPLMAFEKRVNPKTNEQCLIMVKKSLDLRTEEKRKIDIENSKALEKTRFINHIDNEYMRIAQLYRLKMHKEITAHYNAALLAKNAKSKNEIMALLEQIKPDAITKFTSVLLSREELHELFLTTKAPAYSEILLEMQDYIESIFANFDSDLANATAAIAFRESSDKLFELQESEKMKAHQAINTLVSVSSAAIITAPTIKKNMVVKVVDSEIWAKAVIAEFVTNMPYLVKYIRVKSWSSLSIGQMADYLGRYSTDTGVAFRNLELVEVLR